MTAARVSRKKLKRHSARRGMAGLPTRADASGPARARSTRSRPRFEEVAKVGERGASAVVDGDFRGGEAGLQGAHRELGEDDGTAAEVEDLKKAIIDAKMPEEVLTQANKELRRLERMPEAAAEHGMLRSYLDTLIELPWSKSTEDRIDVVEAQRVLDGCRGWQRSRRRQARRPSGLQRSGRGRRRLPALQFFGYYACGSSGIGLGVERLPCVRASLLQSVRGLW